jgi:outer membrane protein TolC
VQHTNIEQASTQQMMSAYLNRDTFTHRITPAEDVVKTAQEVLSLTKQRHKPGLGSIVEVTQSEVGRAATQTK